MYNYSNRIWESSHEYDPITVEEILNLELEHEGTQLNHYPVRVFTFRLDRENILKGKLKTLYVRSKYRGKILVSAYEVKVSKGITEVILRKVHVGE